MSEIDPSADVPLVDWSDLGVSGVLAFTAFPKAHWQRIWSNNPIERLDKEIKRRADVVEIFPNPPAFLRLATVVVIQAHDEWQVTRRYLSDVSMDELRAVITAKHAAATLAEQYQIT
jgi:putative transposase